MKKYTRQREGDKFIKYDKAYERACVKHKTGWLVISFGSCW